MFNTQPLDLEVIEKIKKAFPKNKHGSSNMETNNNSRRKEEQGAINHTKAP